MSLENDVGYERGVCDQLLFKGDLKKVTPSMARFLLEHFPGEDTGAFVLRNSYQKNMRNKKEYLRYFYNSDILYPFLFFFCRIGISFYLLFFTVHPSIHGSTALVGLGYFFSFLNYTQSIGLLGRGISPSQGR
jgi:hypothetical protein